MKFFLIPLAFIFLSYNFTFAQSSKGFPKEYKVLNVKPAITDATIKEADSPHLVVYNPAAKQGKLLFFMPGTGGIA